MPSSKEVKLAARPQQPAADPLFSSYTELATGLLEQLSGACLLDEKLQMRGKSGRLDTGAAVRWLQSLGWTKTGVRSASAARTSAGEYLVALPVDQSDGKLLGVFCVQLPSTTGKFPDRIAQLTATRLKPLLSSLHRELAASRMKRSKERTLTERTEELEWLFTVTHGVSGSSDDRRVIEELLAASTARLNSVVGTLFIPDKRMAIEHVRTEPTSAPLIDAFRHTRQHLLTWAQRRNRPLVVNNAGARGEQFARCKILAVPIVLSTGRVIGVLAFFNTPDAADYATRQTFLARHLGRQIANLAEAQFDLMTGLYTRSALELAHTELIKQGSGGTGSVIYIDVDRLHVVNESHGFELGNELLVRVADLLAPPLLPDGALSGRLSGDRFAVILPAVDAHNAAATARQLAETATRIQIGPPQSAVEVSVSCGIADVVDMPQGLARALAAAEIACKLAKDRGRNRVEIYACEDGSMMRRRDDVAAVGQLRSALKTDRLVLYAQRIVPLQNARLQGGYEILMRLRNPDGTLVAPGPLIDAAQRYQLLPSIDRWIAQSALRILAPYRGMLESREIAMSINVSGQSIGDEAFIQQFADNLKTANLPVGSVTIEITEQAAVKNLARANDLIQRLTKAGCRFALDDFGTGMNSLAYLKNLPISHVKIDGSFVRDILTDSRSQATVRGIVELAKGFGIATVAEYVENEEIANFVRKLGVDYGQGYAFGKPEPLAELLSSLSRDESARMRKLFLEL